MAKTVGLFQNRITKEENFAGLARPNRALIAKAEAMDSGCRTVLEAELRSRASRWAYTFGVQGAKMEIQATRMCLEVRGCPPSGKTYGTACGWS